MLHMLNLRVNSCSCPSSARSRASSSFWSVGIFAFIGCEIDSRSIVSSLNDNSLRARSVQR